MIARAGLAVAALFALAAPGGVREEHAPPAFVSALAGPWQIVPVGGAPACPITLGRAPARVGWTAGAGALCVTSAPPAAAVTAWTFRDGLVLLDARGEAVMRFEEDEGAPLSNPSVAAPAFYLVPAIPGFDRLRQPREWEGLWQVTGKGTGPCVLRFGPPTITDGQHMGGRVTVHHCAHATVRRMTGWYLEGLRVMLTGPGDAQIAFAPEGAATHRSADRRWRLAAWKSGPAVRRRGPE